MGRKDVPSRNLRRRHQVGNDLCAGGCRRKDEDCETVITTFFSLIETSFLKSDITFRLFETASRMAWNSFLVKKL